jgi:hypothetical protein
MRAIVTPAMIFRGGVSVGLWPMYGVMLARSSEYDGPEIERLEHGLDVGVPVVRLPAYRVELSNKFCRERAHLVIFKER